MRYLLTRLLLLLALAIILFPILWLALTAFKQPRDVFDLSLLFTPTLENLREIFRHPWNLGRKVANSVIVSVATVVIAIPVATLAAYSFSRFPLPGKRVMFFLLLATQFIPGVVVVLPFFLLFRDLGLLDTRLGLVVVNLAVVTPFAVWMIKGFIDGVPLEAEEAAMVDGASRLRTIVGIVVPMALPGIIVAAVFCFILSWNEFLFALVLTREDAVTLPRGLVLFRTERGDLWELMAATGLIVTLPVFALSTIIQRHFRQGISSGAVR